MKKFAYGVLPLALIVLLGLVGCPEKKPSPTQNSTPTETAAGDDEPEVQAVADIPTIVARPTAGCYILQDNGIMKYVMQLEQYAELMSYGIKEKHTYIYNNENRDDDFIKCRVDNNGEMQDLWILHFNIVENSSLGVVTKTCLLYTKDKIEKLSSDEVKIGDLVLVDNGYSGDMFSKIQVPALKNKEYFIMLSDLSTSPSDVQVAKIFRAAKALNKDSEKQKRQLLQTAVDNFPDNPLITLIYDELNAMDEAAQGQTDGGEKMASDLDENPPTEDYED